MLYELSYNGPCYVTTLELVETEMSSYILTKFLATGCKEIVDMTTSDTANGEYFVKITTVSLIAFCEVNAGVLLMFIIETISRASIDHSGKLHTSPLTRSLRYEIWQQSPVHDNAVVSGWRPVLNRVNSLTPERRGNCASILFILI